MVGPSGHRPSARGLHFKMNELRDATMQPRLKVVTLCECREETDADVFLPSPASVGGFDWGKVIRFGVLPLRPLCCYCLMHDVQSVTF